LIGITSPENTKTYSYAVLDIDPLIACLIKNESAGNPEAVGDGGLAYGILQFHKKTFDYYSMNYGLKLDYHSPQDQITLAKIMLKNNLGYHWTTYKLCN